MTAFLAPLAIVALVARQGSLPAGKVVPDVRAAADASQGYALYLPSGYTPARQWPLILVFDPAARGAVAVDRFQAAAERYGYIVAGSNTSRNGIPNGASVISTLVADVFARFPIDQRRVYTAGMSGGARVAFGIALASQGIAGVIACSAGYPDSQPRKTVPFPVFATAGTEDFNYYEVRSLDRELTTPHLLTVFQGGHVWASNDLLVDGVEWMEIQAMKSGLAPKDATKIDAIFDKRVKAAAAKPAASLEAWRAYQSIASDFDGLVDVTAYVAKAEALGRDGQVRAAERRDRDDLARERDLLAQAVGAEQQLADPDQRLFALTELRGFWKEWSGKANKAQDSAERRLARRVISNLAASATTTDPAYREIISKYRLTRR